MKKILFLITSLLCLQSLKAGAAIFVNPGTGGTNICMSRAQDGTAPAFTTLGTINFVEGNNADITTGPHTLVISAPAGWVFNTAVPPGVTFTPGRNITAAGFAGMTSTTVTINVITSGTTLMDIFNITGLQVQATNTTSLAGNIRPIAFAGLTGINPGTNLAAVSLLVPSVSFAQSPAGAICAGTTVTFTATPVNGGASPTYSWELNGTPVATGATYPNSTLADGNTIRVVMVSTGCVTTVNSTTSTMTVNPLPAALTGSLNLCPGGTTTLSSTSSGGGWISSASGVATVSGGTVSGVAPGTSNISYTLPTGCRTVSQVTVAPLPAAFPVTGGGSFCASGSGLPVGMGNSTSGVTYDLSDGTSIVASTTGTGAAFDFGTFTTAGTYTVTATDPVTTCSRSMTGSATIIVAAPVTPGASIDIPATPICTGLPATFTTTLVNAGPTPTYQWLVNSIPVATTSTYSYTPADGDVLSFTLTPGGICTDPASVTDVHTISVTAMANPAITTTMGSPNPSCQGSPVTFSAIAAFGGTAPSYRWTKNGVNVATGPAYSYVPASGDVVFCRLTSNFACRNYDTVLSTPITVNTQASASLPVVNIIAIPGTNVPSGTPVSLTAVATGTSVPVAYQWLVNGTPIPGATASALTSNTFVNGDIVTCQVTNMDPCAKFTLKSVSFGSGTSGIADAAKDAVSFTLMPNPNRGAFNIRGTMNSGMDEEVNVEVTDVLGRMAYKGVLKAEQGKVDADVQLENNPANGMYLLILRSKTEQKVLRFVMER